MKHDKAELVNLARLIISLAEDVNVRQSKLQAKCKELIPFLGKEKEHSFTTEIILIAETIVMMDELTDK